MGILRRDIYVSPVLSPMSERVDSTRGDAPRATTGREWDVFVSEGDDPPRHAGSVSAPTVDVAREQATRLLGWSADHVWLCPADEIERVSTTDQP